ncbi:MAG TPA: cupredoxin family copper-binding protein [Dyella sp.]|uniref:cupredoxin domain-containing protein n=1 Tax=Dyella sp. TaxID=1869338 RepID=UPI002D772D69|nr:cupredoxin family copper-binding protein [Dyella sp.]HET6553999.1 cupredoxin family copper-binding protein [Dyella sp.]
MKRALVAWMTPLLLAGTVHAAAGDVADAMAKIPAARIEIRNFAFAPNTLTVKAGTRITWINRDDEPHVVVSAGKQFDTSPALDTGDSYAAVLSKPGTYAYYCAIHPMMVGTIIVQ